VITENMGGYTWYKNSRLNRLTAWANNPMSDIPSEIIYLEDMETKKVWSLGQNPAPDNNDYYISLLETYKILLQSSLEIFLTHNKFEPSLYSKFRYVFDIISSSPNTGFI